MQISETPSFVAGIAASIRLFCRGELDRAGTDRLIKLAARIAQQRLWGRFYAASRTQGTTVEEQALSHVAHLFCRDGPDSDLAKALDDVLDGDDYRLYLRFQAVVTRAASQELFRRWRETDSLSARLWRNLHRALRHDSRFVAFPADKPQWVALAEADDLHSHFPPPGHRQLVGILGESSSDSAGIGDLIVTTLSRIADLSCYSGAIPVEALFSALREVRSADAKADIKSWSARSERDPLLHRILEMTVNSVTEAIDLKLKRYGTIGKLMPEAAGAFKLALNDMILDLADGGPSQSYYQYLCAYWPSLTREAYRTTYRTKFEYLAETAGKLFLEAMKKELT